VPRRAAGALVHSRLAANTARILHTAGRADLIVDGTAERSAQVRCFLGFHTSHPPPRGDPGDTPAPGRDRRARRRG